MIQLFANNIFLFIFLIQLRGNDSKMLNIYFVLVIHPEMLSNGLVIYKGKCNVVTKRIEFSFNSLFILRTHYHSYFL